MTIVPNATYRLQVSPQFPFKKVEGLTDYLADLGVSHVYAAPIYASREGSDHGYDVVNMNEINPRLGGEEGLRELSKKLRGKNIGWIQDIVPNHRAFDGANPLLMDVLEKGPYSRFYRFFDILWEHPYDNIRGRVLTPFLGNFYNTCLENGELILVYTDGDFRIRYYQLSLPIRVLSYARILRLGLAELGRKKGRANPDIVRLQGILGFIDRVESEHAENPEFDHFSFVKGLFNELYESSPLIREHVEQCLARLNGTKGSHGSFDELDELLSEQYFRLSYWKVGTEELNYRRFFSINHLICLRVEDEEVYQFTHRLTRELYDQGIFDGLRLDHIDGLYDPTAYVRSLRRDLPNAYIVAEKILHGREQLPEEWPIQGTTGYDFLNAAQQVMTAGENEEQLEEIYRSFSGLAPTYEKLVLDNKRMIIGKHMAGDIDNLALQLKAVANRYRYGRDLTLYGLRRALVELLAVFPVYRTYAGDEGFSERDRSLIESSIRRCIETAPLMRNEFELIRRFLLRDPGLHLSAEESTGWWHFLLRFQQYTGPLMAKGVEDTVFYLYYRLISHNEVGCDPNELAISSADFHRIQKERRENWPNAMNCSATHDTKRGEDSRARIVVLSEIPQQWGEMLYRFSELAAPLKTGSGKKAIPSANDEYLIYQSMLGAVPFQGIEHDDFPTRLREFAIKAARESGAVTSWLNVNEAYEKALVDFIERLTTGAQGEGFRDFFGKMAKPILRAGITKSYAQTAMKLSVPGVPDIYQGCELWDLSFVDPDNRRAVNFEQRKQMLKRIHETPRGSLLEQIAAQPESGLGKLLLIAELLALRKKNPALFAEGSYEGIVLPREADAGFLAFRREHEGRSLLVVVPRRTLTLRDKMKSELAVVIDPLLKETPMVNLLTKETATGVVAELERFSVLVAVSY